MALIQPLRRGDDLLQEIHSTQTHGIAVWWLGQSGYVLKTADGILVVDPYLSEHLTKKYEGTGKPHIRMTESPLRPADLTDVDLILSSHKHSDHLDPGTLPGLMAASPRSRLALPAALLDHAMSLGLPPDRLVGLNAGETFSRARFHVRAIPSVHEGLDTDAAGRHLYLGFLIEARGIRLYHSGDCMLYDELPRWLGADRLDVMFLPINGRDPARGVAGNMSAADAVALASRMRPRYVVPHHYDMFTFNTVPIATFETEAARLPDGVRSKILRCGERWEILP